MNKIVVHKRKSYGNMLAVYWVTEETYNKYGCDIGNVPLNICGIDFVADTSISKE